MSDYTIDAIWHPALEMTVSLQTFLSVDLHKVVDLGAAWRTAVRRTLPRPFAAQLQSMIGQPDASLVIGIAPACVVQWVQLSGGSEADFIGWLDAQDVAGMYAIAAKLVPAGMGVPTNLMEVKQSLVDLLTKWHAHYWTGVDRRILAGLASADEDLRAQIAAGGADLIEAVSGGVKLKADASFDHVTLIPQYHARPWNIYGLLGRTVLQFYPVEALPPEPGEPSPRLMRMLRALNEPKRLAMLRLLGGERKTMSEIAREVHLSKATVHYHLVLLRAAGLIRVETTLAKSPGDSYTLRRTALDGLPQEIAAYLDSPVDGQAPYHPAGKKPKG
jgi:DNA-binding transcriptional ArsR family regulator